MKHSVVPDYQYHTFISINLNNHSTDSTKSRLDDIEFRQQITQKISSYLIKFFVKNSSRKNLFPVQYVYERKRGSNYHLHILLGRLDVDKCFFNKKILNHLKKYHSLDRIDYDLVDAALKFAFRQMKINDSKIVMSGSKALDIRRVWDIDGVKDYLSKYENVRCLRGNEYEYEPFHSIQV